MLAKLYFFLERLELNPPRLHITLFPHPPFILLNFVFPHPPVILLNFVLYLPLYSSVYIPQLHFIQHGTYGQPGEESLFTEESRSPP